MSVVSSEITSGPQNVGIITGQLGIGGAERQLLLWLSHMDRQRFRPAVVTLNPATGDHWAEHVKSLGIPLIAVPRSRNKIARAFRIAKALKGHRPRLVHGWNMFASVYAGLTAVLLRHSASLGSLRSSIESYKSQQWQGFLAYHLLDGLVVNSPATARELAAYRPRQRLFVVPNAVEDLSAPRKTARAFFSERWAIPGSRIWLGSLGRLEPSKKFSVLVELAASLIRSAVDVHLVLIGSGREREAIEARATELNILDRVTFTGELSEARRWLGALDVFCFPSVSEGMPNAVLEAAAAELPVVGWRLPYMEDLLVDGESAYLIAPGDTAAMQRILTRLAHQPAERRRLGVAARQTVLTRFGREAFCNRMSAAYEQAIGADAG